MEARGDFFYPLAWRGTRAHPGRHASRLQGGTEEFAGLEPFVRNPRARQIDIRASLADPLGQWRVRSYRQRSSIAVEVMADFSASMNWVGRYDKRETLSRLVATMAWSAYREGDWFGFQAANEGLIEELTLPARLYKGGVPEFCTKLLHYPRSGQGHQGFLQAAAQLGRARRLVFLISDFHWAEAAITEVLAALVRHDVVPVVLWDPAESEIESDYGLVVVADPETGQKRRLFLRPALRKMILEHFEARRQTLTRLLGSVGRPPLYVDGGFVADDLTAYFLSTL